jgi:hypothetical protein
MNGPITRTWNKGGRPRECSSARWVCLVEGADNQHAVASPGTEKGSRVRRLIAAVGVAAFLAVGAAPGQPYVKSISCDLLRGKYTNCQVTLWNRNQNRYVTYPVSDKRTLFCFDRKITDCVLRVWHPRLERYRFYWGLSVDVTRVHGGG